MSPEAAKGALQKLRDGYHNPNGRGYGEAQKTASGCLEVQKAVNASVSGKGRFFIVPKGPMRQHGLTSDNVLPTERLCPDRASVDAHRGQEWYETKVC